jgi:prepilin-type processing-associated H-X9-DG protein/prepilin-type N-terminal cleavage/methylation domain-containing protein
MKIRNDWAGAARSGFTLTELLVVVAILGILTALLTSGVKDAQKRALAARCAGNLRQIGAAMHLYAADHNQMIDITAYKGAGTSVPWLRFLTGKVTPNYDRGSGGTVYLDTPEIAACPAFPPYRNVDDSNFCYGTVEQPTDPYSRPQVAPGIVSPSRQISLSALDQPSRYWLLTDTYHPDHNQQFYAIDRLHNRRGVHLRHNGRANVLFADGHVELADGKSLKELTYNPLTAGFDDKQNPVKFE